MPSPDSGLLLETLAGFAENLTRGYAIGDVLHDLASQVPEVLGVVGAGVTLTHDGRVHFVTAPIEAIAETERLQDELQSGPCMDAVATAQPVTVYDLETDEWFSRWPEYVGQARAAGLRAAAGVPMLAAGQAIGAINLYDTRPRAWSSDDLHVAGILAAMATSYLLHASALQQQRRTSEQLQQALSTRVIIEQAKGTLAAARGASVDEAFGVMRKYARDHNRRIHDVADAVVNQGLRP
jgi:GAF domain-containing protein